MAEEPITIWCLLGRKAGDNTQVRALADELGLVYESKTVVARPWELLAHLGPRATLAGIDRAASSPLTAPWPDLVITAGRRNEPVAHWIRQRSAGRTRIVHLGRPWTPLETWDLIITTPQYFLPRRPNIVHNTLPLNRLLPADLALEGASLAPSLNGFPRPWIAVLAGGDSGPFVFTPDKAARLARLAGDLASATGGAVLCTDSPRTPVGAGDVLQQQLPAASFCYRCRDGGSNPYRGLLALADAFVVTGESMSMLGEAAAMARPLFIFDMGDSGAHWWRLPHNYRYKPLSFRLAMQLAPKRMRRDIGNIQRALVGSGRADWLTAGDGLAMAAEKIRGAMAADASASLRDPSAGVSELRASAEVVRRLLPAN